MIHFFTHIIFSRTLYAARNARKYLLRDKTSDVGVKTSDVRMSDGTCVPKRKYRSKNQKHYKQGSIRVLGHINILYISVLSYHAMPLTQNEHVTFSPLIYNTVAITTLHFKETSVLSNVKLLFKYITKVWLVNDISGSPHTNSGTHNLFNVTNFTFRFCQLKIHFQRQV